MKSERISIFNYEAFYLDHLEGTLGEEDTALLLAFLEDHPELVVEDDDFILLDPKNDTSIFTDKDSLKMVSDEAAIGLSNVEYFLVAEAEGQLTTSKQKELNSFVSQHPQLEKERAYLAAMFLKADESIVYANKAGLKRKGAIVFWPYIALAAASILIAFFVLMNFDSSESVMAKEDPDNQKALPKEETPIEEPTNIQIANDDVETNSAEPSRGNASPNQGLNAKEKTSPERPKIATINTLKHNSARRVLNSVDDQDLQPVASQMKPPSQTLAPDDDYTLAMSSEMKNPIQPITSRIGKALKTDVDFQTGKAANNSGAGFHLKIGKFEISRNKGGKKEKN